MQDVSSFLSALGLERYVALFKEHEIDFDVFPDLTAEDLTELKLPVGPRRKILEAIKVMDAPPGASELERRQLTVVFIDMVGFTAISRVLDPEDLFEMISQYQGICAELTHSLGGQIARYIGDGVLALFGWPVATETSTQDAIRASLAAANRIEELSTAVGFPVSVRVGVANGLVLVGRMSSHDVSDAYGATVNLASRLQSIARPGEVVVDERVRNMIKHRFKCRALGEHEIKGFEKPVSTWRVVAEQPAVRPQAPDETQSRLVGRDNELAALLAAWSMVEVSDPRIICIRGDPGLGKSRLSSEFLNEIRPDRKVLSFFGAPEAGQIPLWPIREHVSAIAGISSGDSGEERREKISSLVSKSGLRDSEHTPLFAELCGLDPGAFPRGVSPERRKAVLFDGLLQVLSHQVAGEPTVVLFEDLHWFDHTSREFVTFLVGSSIHAPELILATTRPYPELASWADGLFPTYLDLNPLTDSDAAALYLQQVGESGRLDPESTAEAVARSDGVPLFIEELASSAKSPDFDGGIPETLGELLIARLDKLGAGKEIAQTAAVLDRDITEELLAVTTGKKQDDIRNTLAKLVSERVLISAPREGPERSGYLFRHALLREAAYENQLLRVRQKTHGKVADFFIENEQQRVESQPQVVATHLAQARRNREAVGYFRCAGLRALSQAHYFEAETLFRSSLEQLSRASQKEHSDDRTTKLELLTELGAALIAREGFGAANVGETFDAAESIGRDIGPGPALARALWGSWLYCLVSGNLERANALTLELSALGEAGLAAGDSNLLVEARFARGNTLFWKSDIAGSLEALHHAVELYDPEAHADHDLLFGQDPLVATHCYLAYSNWACGHHSASRASLRAAIDHARSKDHPFTSAWALCFPPMITSLRRETWAAKRLSSIAIAHTGEQMLPFWHSAMTIVHGWAVARGGEIATGLAEAEAGLQMYIATGSNTVQPYFRGLVAECLSMAGHFGRAEAMLGQAFEGARHSGEAISENTLYVYLARILRARGADADMVAEPLRKAIEMARTNGAVTIEVEAALELCKTLDDSTSRSILSNAISRTPEPHKTRDGRRAVTLLKGVSD